MELIFCNFSKRKKRADETERRRGEGSKEERECVKKKRKGRNKWEKPGRGRRRRKNEESGWAFLDVTPCKPPPQPLLSETCWHVDVASRRERWGKRKKGKHERRKEWRVVGGRREKRKIISYIRRPRCNGGYFALQNTRATPSPTLSHSLLIPGRATMLKIISISSRALETSGNAEEDLAENRKRWRERGRGWRACISTCLMQPRYIIREKTQFPRYPSDRRRTIFIWINCN